MRAVGDAIGLRMEVASDRSAVREYRTLHQRIIIHELVTNAVPKPKQAAGECRRSMTRPVAVAVRE